MRLVTFEDPARQSRVGAVTPDERIVDLHTACALYLRDVEHESAFYRQADALVPPNMRALFCGGDTSLEAARKAFTYVLHDDRSPGPRGEATVSGVAAFSGDPKAWYLKAGDVMECEIEHIGVLRNHVISWQEAYGRKPVSLATQETVR